VATGSSTEVPPYAAGLLGRIAVESGHFEEARQALEGISRGEERTLTTYRLGRAYEGLGETAKALEAYRTFLSRTAPADEELGAVTRAQEAVTRLGG